HRPDSRPLRCPIRLAGHHSEHPRIGLLESFESIDALRHERLASAQFAHAPEESLQPMQARRTEFAAAHDFHERLLLKPHGKRIYARAFRFPKLHASPVSSPKKLRALS